jgi:hypothetical protein
LSATALKPSIKSDLTERRDHEVERIWKAFDDEFVPALQHNNLGGALNRPR